MDELTRWFGERKPRKPRPEKDKPCPICSGTPGRRWNKICDKCYPLCPRMSGMSYGQIVNFERMNKAWDREAQGLENLPGRNRLLESRLKD